MEIDVKRAYEKADKSDGLRVLVDRLWPRGVSKEDLHADLWLKDMAPETQLRQWFGHDPARWPEFKTRYEKQMENRQDEIGQLREAARGRKKITLVYAAKDERHNNAVVLKDWLEKHAGF